MAPPLRPDAPTARRWLSDELANGRYRDGRSLMELLEEWLESLFRIGNPLSPQRDTVIAVVAVLLGLALLAVIVVMIRRWRRGAPATRASQAPVESEVGPLDDPASHRRTAERLRAAGNHPAAVIESYRALVAAAAARREVTLIPGLTAQQAGRQVITAHRNLQTEIQYAADCFDRARYADARPGGSMITAADAEAVAELERLLSERRLAGTRHGR